MMGKYIHDSKLINESFDCHYINLTTAKNLEDIGHFRLGKIVEFAKLLYRIVLQGLCSCRDDKVDGMQSHCALP